MNSLLLILASTPWWVFALFAGLLALGIQTSRSRTVGLRRVLITPAMFVGWGLVSLFQAASASPFILPAWLLAAAAALPLALATTRFGGLGADRARGLVHVPGSWLPLARSMIIFFAKGGLAVAIETHPLAHDQLVIWDMAASGAILGYFVGWAIRFVLSYRRAGASGLVHAASG
jgi:hypothetical protein